MAKITLYQPEIPQNVGTLLRLSSCFGFKVEIIGPILFQMTDKKLKRAGLDYIDRANYTIHESWEKYLSSSDGRIVAATTTDGINFHQFNFLQTDEILIGKESAGLPCEIKKEIQHKVTIPMMDNNRSINMAVSAAILISELYRQNNMFA